MAKTSPSECGSTYTINRYTGEKLICDYPIFPNDRPHMHRAEYGGHRWYWREDESD